MTFYLEYTIGPAFLDLLVKLQNKLFSHIMWMAVFEGLKQGRLLLRGFDYLPQDGWQIKIIEISLLWSNSSKGHVDKLTVCCSDIARLSN